MARRRRWRALPALALVAVVAVACADDSTGDDDAQPELRLNELQMLGSHNSYHLAPEQKVLNAIGAFNKALAAELDYTHRSITEQLEDFGIRQLEIDVYPDTAGGRFANRPALTLVGSPTESGEAALEEPGFKVLHLVDADFLSSCLTFVACLDEVETWSSDNPDHVPIMIMVEAKEGSLASEAAATNVDLSALPVKLTEVEPWTPERFDELEEEILSVFDRDRVITPDDVRGDHDTLEEAVLAGDAWPLLDDARGKVLFSLVDTGPRRDTYVGDATSLQGKLLFTSSEEGRPDAAFIRVDDPVAGAADVQRLVEAGYLIRSRADVPAVHAVKGDTSSRDAALENGAHYVSTDYYAEDPDLGTGYVASMPGAPAGGDAARCNPVNAPPDCTQELVTG